MLLHTKSIQIHKFYWRVEEINQTLYTFHHFSCAPLWSCCTSPTFLVDSPQLFQISTTSMTTFRTCWHQCQHNWHQHQLLLQKIRVITTSSSSKIHIQFLDNVTNLPHTSTYCHVFAQTASNCWILLDMPRFVRTVGIPAVLLVDASGSSTSSRAPVVVKVVVLKPLAPR